MQASEGKLPDPKTLYSWTYNFSKIPEFTFGDLYSYLIGKDDYSPKSDGHVVDLKYCPVEGKKLCFFEFKDKPIRPGQGFWVYGILGLFISGIWYFWVKLRV